MQTELNDILRAINRENMASIWKRAKTGDLNGLDDEEKLIARIMQEHEDEFHSQFDTAGEIGGSLLESGKEVNPFMHVVIHVVVENQLAAREPIEAFQFYNAMRKKKVPREEVIHLLGFFLIPLLFHTMETGVPFDERRYRGLLKKMKKKKPWKIADLLGDEFEDLMGPNIGYADHLEKIDSKNARRRLDDLIDQVDEGGDPVLLQGRGGSEAVLVSREDYDLFLDTEAMLMEMESEEAFFSEKEGGADVLSFPGNDNSRVLREGLPLSPSFKEVLQFKVNLKGIRPPVWRRIQVPADYTFWDLHVAIQDAMGWEDRHLYQFIVPGDDLSDETWIGVPSQEIDFIPGGGLRPAWGCRLGEYLSPENPKVEYLYDYGSDWVHIIELEKIVDREKRQPYPRCLKGKRACPPEDCGGVPGYYRLLEDLEIPGSALYEDALNFLGGDDYKPDQFSTEKIEFRDPRNLLEDIPF